MKLKIFMIKIISWYGEHHENYTENIPVVVALAVRAEAGFVRVVRVAPIVDVFVTVLVVVAVFLPTVAGTP